MKKVLIILACLIVTTISAQNCHQYPELIRKAKQYWANREFEKALNQLFAAREHCPTKGPEIDAQLVTFTNDIAKKFKEAEMQAEIAQKAKDQADKAAKEAQKAKSRSDSTANAARLAARLAYANDLAYKSQVALKEDDYISAYRLALFASQYVDENNPNVSRALTEAETYYDYRQVGPTLPLRWSLSLEGHRSYVYCVSFSPDGQKLVTGSHDNTAKVWELSTGTVLLSLEGHHDAVKSVSFSPDGQRLATGSRDKTVKVWELSTGKMLLSLKGHSYAVESVCFSPDGQRLATGSKDKTAIVWDLNTGKALFSLERHREAVESVSFSPDGQRLATGSWDHTAKVWDLNTGNVMLSLEGHLDAVESISFSPDGQKLATGSWDKTVKVWDLNTGKALLSMEGHSDYVYSVNFSIDGQMLATGSGDKTAKVWDLNTGNTLLTLEGHRDVVWSLNFSPDGQKLATGSSDHMAKVWKLNLTTNPRWDRNFMPFGLKFAKLVAFGLENLLDQKPDNEAQLIDSHEVWQISAFADLYAERIAKSIPLRADYERAERLYQACIKDAEERDKAYFQKQLAELERVWKERGK